MLQVAIVFTSYYSLASGIRLHEASP